jgi:hypothetical protein
MLYTGDAADFCPISFAPVCDLEQPVGFDAGHAFECECIVEWLTLHRSTNPLTGKDFSGALLADILHPLIVCGNNEHVPETLLVLSNAGRAIGHAKCDAGRLVRKMGVNMLLLAYVILSILHMPTTFSFLGIFLQFACIMWQHPVNGKRIIALSVAVVVYHMGIVYACSVFSRVPSFSVILHVVSLQLLVVKTIMDVNMEAFGVRLR